MPKLAVLPPNRLTLRISLLFLLTHDVKVVVPIVDKSGNHAFGFCIIWLQVFHSWDLNTFFVLLVL
jgi:hypothetical protein